MKLTNKSLIKLFIAALIMVALAVVVYFKPETRNSDFTKGTILVQGIEPSAIDKLVLKNGDETATILRKGDAFKVEQKQDFPADIDDINRILVSMFDTRLESVASKELTGKNAADFGLDKPATVELFNDKGKSLVKLQVGSMAANGSFVSLGKKVYISQRPFEFSAKPMDYINQSLLALNPEEVETVVIKRKDDEISFKNVDNALKLQNIPEGKDEDSSKVWSLKAAVTRINFDDVKKSDSVGAVSLNGNITITMKSGMKYILQFDTVNSEHLISASATQPPQEMVKKSMQIRQDSDQKELAAKDAVLQAITKAKNFNNRHKGWFFKISEYDFKKLDVSLNDLLKDKPKPEKKEEKTAATTPDTPKPEAAK